MRVGWMAAAAWTSAGEAWTGRYATPLGVQLLESTGMSPTAASLTYGLGGLLGGTGAALSLEEGLATAAATSTRTASQLADFPEVPATTKIGDTTVSATVRPVDILPGDPNRIAVIGRRTYAS